MPKSPDVKSLQSRLDVAPLAILALLLFAIPVRAKGPVPQGWMHKGSPIVLQRVAEAPGEFIVVLAEQADLSASVGLSTKEEKGQYVYRSLRDVAKRTARQTGIDDGHEADSVIDTPVTRSSLHQNQPNPFNPATRIEYEVPRRSRVMLTVHDVTGKKVRTLVPPSIREVGRFAVQWDGRDNEGRALASGVYFARLETDGRVLASRRMTLVR